MPKVLLSYSRRDKDFVRKLSDALAEQKRETPVGWEDILLAARW